MNKVDKFTAAAVEAGTGSDRYNRNQFGAVLGVDARLSKAFSLSGKRRLEGIFQVFNLFGRDNLGGIGSSFQTHALWDSFGQLLTAQNRQQAEIAVRLTF